MFVNVSRAQAQNEIASREHVTDVSTHKLEPRLVTGAAMPVRGNFIDDRLAADSGQRRFTRRIDIGHDHAVGVIKSTAEFLAQRLRARVAMRLKHGQHAVAPDRLRRCEGRANFGGMMRVIIDEQEPIAGIFDFETATRMSKIAQRTGNLFECNSEFGRQRDHAERVADVMPTRNIQRDVAEKLVSTEHTES